MQQNFEEKKTKHICIDIKKKANDVNVMKQNLTKSFKDVKNIFFLNEGKQCLSKFINTK